MALQEILSDEVQSDAKADADGADSAEGGEAEQLVEDLAGQLEAEGRAEPSLPEHAVARKTRSPRKARKVRTAPEKGLSREDLEDVSTRLKRSTNYIFAMKKDMRVLKEKLEKVDDKESEAYKEIDQELAKIAKRTRKENRKRTTLLAEKKKTNKYNKKKLDKDFQKYTILGACNPPLAFEALNDEQGIGLLLPCNVVLWENEDLSTTIAAIDANRMMTIVENNHLYSLANKVNTLLQKAVDNV